MVNRTHRNELNIDFQIKSAHSGYRDQAGVFSIQNKSYQLKSNYKVEVQPGVPFIHAFFLLIIEHETRVNSNSWT